MEWENNELWRTVCENFRTLKLYDKADESQKSDIEDHLDLQEEGSNQLEESISEWKDMAEIFRDRIGNKIENQYLTNDLYPYFSDPKMYYKNYEGSTFEDIRVQGYLSFLELKNGKDPEISGRAKDYRFRFGFDTLSLEDTCSKKCYFYARYEIVDGNLSCGHVEDGRSYWFENGDVSVEINERSDAKVNEIIGIEGEVDGKKGPAKVVDCIDASSEDFDVNSALEIVHNLFDAMLLKEKYIQQYKHEN